MVIWHPLYHNNHKKYSLNLSSHFMMKYLNNQGKSFSGQSLQTKLWSVLNATFTNAEVMPDFI